MTVTKDDDENRRVIQVLGAAHHDTTFTARKEIVPKHTTNATSQRSFGGVGYNIANILCLIGNSVGIVTVSSDDSISSLIRRNLESLGIHINEALIPGFPTASYTALNSHGGELHVGVLVQEIYDQLTVGRLRQHAAKLTDENTQAIVTDSTFNEEIYIHLATLVAQHSKRLFVVISSLENAKNITALLPHTEALFGNVEEINFLAQNFDSSEAGIWKSLETLSNKGAKAVLATHGERGVYALVQGQKMHFAAHKVDKIVSTLGAGDTFASVVIDGMLKGVKPEEAIKRGLSAAALRVQGKEINRDAIMHGLQVEQQQKETKKLFQRARPTVF